ncbi:MAG TPA: tetratricopeptide repeat protein [Gemmatimonadota bacterium]|nr:tetratricopeptide repeat protein [Gemmatimonadota bacterium]
MTTFQKLKHEARRAEQRSDWARAIDLYQRALDADEDMADLSLYNRIGDLHLRLGENEAAVEYYERAVERYADNAMHTSAIALCNKILRIAPGRTSIYRRLGLLHARTGLLVEGRGNMVAYVRHVLADGEPEDAALAVAEFVELTKDDEICLQYAAELTERDETTAAAAQLRAAARLRTDRGEDAAELHARIAELDPDGGVATGASSASVEPEDGRPPERLANLVARQLADQGADAAFEADAPPRAPVAAAPTDDDLAEVRVQVDRFRSRVADVLETGDPTIRYDLGVEFMTIGLLEEAIEEFRVAVADPRLLEAANARIGECLALRGSEASFEVLRRASRASLGSGASGGSGGDAQAGAEGGTPEAPESAETAEPAVAPGSGGAPDAPEAAERHEADPPAGETDADEVSAMADDRRADAEEDAIQGHFFRARLAQYRIRRAEERHQVDHAAHLDLGAAYIEMGLHQEALRELAVALEGPRPIPGRAVRALRELALRLEDAPELALEVIEQLADSGQGPAADALGNQLAEAWGDDHPLVDRLSELRARLGGAVDELPALEDMFPALQEPDGTTVDAIDTAPDARDAPPGDEQLSDEQMSEAIDEEAGPSADQILVRAAELVGAGDAEGAIEHLEESLGRLDAGHRTREALVVLGRLLELKPDDVTLHEHRTELAMMVSDRDELLAAFARLGACLRRLGDAKRARAAYGRMLDVDPSNELARQAIARIDEAEVTLELESRERAEPSSAPTKAPDSDEDDEELEAMYDFLDGLEEAELEIEPNGAENGAPPEGAEDETEDATARSRYELGLAFRQMGMWDEALRELRPALGRVTDRLGVLEAVGECLFKLGRPLEAIELLQEKLRADEDAEQVGPLYFLGLALQAEDQHEEAREVFRRVEAVQPGYRDAADRLSELSL